MNILSEAYENTLINLKIISQIEENGRISTTQGDIISIENNHIFQGFIRWYNGDSRQKAIDYIRDIIASGCNIAYELLDSNEIKYKRNRYIDTNKIAILESKLQKLNECLKKSEIGLKNLIKTYDGDITTISTLDILINKVQVCCISIDNVFENNNEVPPVIDYTKFDN